MIEADSPLTSLQKKLNAGYGFWRSMLRIGVTGSQEWDTGRKHSRLFPAEEVTGAATNTVVAAGNGGWPSGIGHQPKARVCATNHGNRTIYVIDTASNTDRGPQRLMRTVC